MATGHLNPGYKDIVSKLKRAKSAGLPIHSDCLDPKQTNVDSYVLDEIRRNAREAWSKQHTPCETSYGDHYNRNKLPYAESVNIAAIKPYSFEYRNKPHPSREFLVTTLHRPPGDRMHYIPGLHNADTTVGKPTFSVDAGQPFTEQLKRSMQREKYIGRPATASIRQYADDLTEYDTTLSSYPVPQPMESYVDTLQDEGSPTCIHDKKSPQFNRSPVRQNYDRLRRPHTLPSTWKNSQQYALEDSVDTYKYLNQNDESYYNGRKDSYITTDIVARMEADLERTRLVRGSRSHLAKRGDFTIHPQWPPSIVHHRLNGLSSVEIPYMHGRR